MSLEKNHFDLRNFIAYPESNNHMDWKRSTKWFHILLYHLHELAFGDQDPRGKRVPSVFHVQAPRGGIGGKSGHCGAGSVGEAVLDKLWSRLWTQELRAWAQLKCHVELHKEQERGWGTGHVGIYHLLRLMRRKKKKTKNNCKNATNAKVKG